MLSIKVMLINYGKFIRSGSSMLIGQVCLYKVMLIERFYCISYMFQSTTFMNGLEHMSKRAIRK